MRHAASHRAPRRASGSLRLAARGRAPQARPARVVGAPWSGRARGRWDARRPSAELHLDPERDRIAALARAAPASTARTPPARARRRASAGTSRGGGGWPPGSDRRASIAPSRRARPPRRSRARRSRTRRWPRARRPTRPRGSAGELGLRRERRSSAARLRPRSKCRSAEVPRCVSVRQKPVVAMRVRNRSPTGIAQRSRSRRNTPGGRPQRTPAPTSRVRDEPVPEPEPQLGAAVPDASPGRPSSGNERGDARRASPRRDEAEALQHAVQARQPEVRAEAVVKSGDQPFSSKRSSLRQRRNDRERSASRSVSSEKNRSNPIDRREELLRDEGVARVEPAVLELGAALRPLLRRLLARRRRRTRGLGWLPARQLGRDPRPRRRRAHLDRPGDELGVRRGGGRERPRPGRRARGDRLRRGGARFATRARGAMARNGYRRRNTVACTLTRAGDSGQWDGRACSGTAGVARSPGARDARGRGARRRSGTARRRVRGSRA